MPGVGLAGDGVAGDDGGGDGQEDRQDQGQRRRREERAVGEHVGEQRRALAGSGADAGRAQEDADDDGQPRQQRDGEPRPRAGVRSFPSSTPSIAAASGQTEVGVLEAPPLDDELRAPGRRRGRAPGSAPRAGARSSITRTRSPSRSTGPPPRRPRTAIGRVDVGRVDHQPAGRGEEVLDRVLRHEAALRHHRRAGADQLDLAEEVARQEHGGAAAASSANRARISRMPCGSRPLVGSSSTSSLGWRMSAAARPRRWRMPSE